MQLSRFRLTSEQLQNIPINERSLLMVLAHASNEINTFNKLLFLSTNFSHGREWQTQAQISQSLTLARTLAGKLSEAWTVTTAGYFGTKLSQKHTLDNSGNEAIKKLKNYFGRKNLINSVRNEFAFHYSLERAGIDIHNDTPVEELSIYLHPSIGNSLYQFAEFLINKALMESISPADLEAAPDVFLTEISSVVSWFNDFSQSAIFSILEKTIGIEEVQKTRHEIDIGEVPLSSDIKLPYFLEIKKH